MTEIEKILSEKGFFLGEEGINNWALSKTEAIKVINKLEENGIPVLGGDVIIKKGLHYQYNYDNWYHNIKDDEVSNIKESCCKAREYIRNYPSNDNIFFVLTIG